MPAGAMAGDSGYVLGLSCFYHNSAAALIRDGQLVAAAEEERFTREKADRRFPARAVNYCLEEAGIHQDELSSVVYYDNAYLYDSTDFATFGPSAKPVSPIPEPATMGLLAIGGIALLKRRRRA